MQLRKNAVEHWKYSYDNDQAFIDESNFGIK